MQWETKTMNQVTEHKNTMMHASCMSIKNNKNVNEK